MFSVVVFFLLTVLNLAILIKSIWVYVACISIGNYIARALMNLFVNFVMLLSTLPTAFLTLYTIPRENEGTAVPSFSVLTVFIYWTLVNWFFLSHSQIQLLPIPDSVYTILVFGFRFFWSAVLGLALAECRVIMFSNILPDSGWNFRATTRKNS